MFGGPTGEGGGEAGERVASEDGFFFLPRRKRVEGTGSRRSESRTGDIKRVKETNGFFSLRAVRFSP